MTRRSRLTIAALLVLVAIPVVLTGCTPARNVGEFLKYRYEDFCDMADLGMTFSLKPGFALYANGVGVSPGGFAYIDGWFLGLGGGVIGLKKFYFRSVGLIAWGHETIGWDRFNKLHNENFNKQGVGVLGIMIGPDGLLGNVPLLGGGQSPDYMFACIHNIHLGFIGAVANLRYTQAPDFILGWFGLDPALDDGLQFGRFPWQKRRGPSSEPEPPTAPTSNDNDTGGWMTSDATTVTPVTKKTPQKPGEPEVRYARIMPVDSKPAPAKSAALVPAARTYTVKGGDTLYRIAKDLYGSGKQWEKLYEANRDQMDSPSNLRIGMVLRVPSAD